MNFCEYACGRLAVYFVVNILEYGINRGEQKVSPIQIKHILSVT